jgi:glycosyltransferase involved in cell wall biosynthesis
MRVLLVHDYYRLQGGEDLTYEAEAELLESRGHEVQRFTVTNRDVDRRSRLRLACDTVWNRAVCADLRALAERSRPQVVHFHNTFPLISPAAYYAVRGAGAAVVQTVQNYRHFCANALLYRDGHLCQECLGGRAPWRSVVYGCYRSSRAASAVVTAMVGVHRGLRSWDRAVDVLVAPSRFVEDKLGKLGLKTALVRRKPNLVSGVPAPGRGSGGYAAFVGRLSPEKGVETLVEAWRSIGTSLPLRIAGQGPLAAAGVAGIVPLGQVPPAQIPALIGEAACLIVPSLWFEPFGRVVIEAFACGTPVVASRIGALADLVEDGRTGLLFRAGDAADLVGAIRRLVGDPTALARMREAARAEYESGYSEDRNYGELMEIYELALARRGPGPRRAE